MTASSGSGSWLIATPTTGTIPDTITVSINLAGLTPGTYTGAIIVFAQQVTAIANVTLTIAGQSGVSPSALTFNYVVGSPNLPPAQTVVVSSTAPQQPFLVTGSTTSGGNWLLLPANMSGTAPGAFSVGVNPAGLTPGTYTGQVSVTVGQGTLPIPIPVTLTVTNPLPPMLSVSPVTEIYSLTENGFPAFGAVTVSNLGGGTEAFTALAASDQGNWLVLANTGGAASLGSPGAINFSANPLGVTPGVHYGTITVLDTQSAAKATVTITLAVSASIQPFELSQTGLTFTATANGPAPPAQSFNVNNTGGNSVSWTLQTTTDSSAASSANWLTASAASMVSVPGQAGAPVNVAANAQGLAAGQYFGSVNVNPAAGGGSNVNHTATVVLNVLPSGQAPVQVSSGGVLLFAGAGTAQQQITLFNPASATGSYSTILQPSASWLTVSPAAGLLGPGSNTLTISALSAFLGSTPQTGSVTLVFGDGTTATIQVTAVPVPCGTGGAGSLVPLIEQPLANSVITVGAPQTVQALIFDSCGNPVTSGGGGGAQVSFSSGDAPVMLRDAGNGVWQGTWNPVTSAAQVNVQIASTQGAILGSSATGVAVQAASAAAPPQVAAVVNAAAAPQPAPNVVAPGGYFTIYGAGLAGSGSPSATTLPLGTTLNGAQVLIGGAAVPLVYAAPNQINAIVPQGLTTDTAYDLVVIQGSTRSAPMRIAIARLQPAVFTVNESGSGQGAIEIAGTALIAGPIGQGSRPAVRGSEYLSIYCTGLGPLMPSGGQNPPADGAAAPSSPLFQTQAAVSVSIGGVNAPVTFAGLAPGFASLYQVNVQVPAGTPAGNAVPLQLTLNNGANGAPAPSNTVTVALQ